MKKQDVPNQVWPVAAAAVMGISSSAALARGVAGEAAPAAIACWRVAGASALNLATRRARRGVAALDRRDATLAARSGLLLAAHFLLFFEALRRTSVLRSTILVGLCPLWVGLADRVSGREVPDAFWLGCASAVAGTAVLAGDASVSDNVGDVTGTGYGGGVAVEGLGTASITNNKFTMNGTASITNNQAGNGGGLSISNDVRATCTGQTKIDANTTAHAVRLRCPSDKS